MKRLRIVDDDPDHPLILRTRFEAKANGCEETDDGEVRIDSFQGKYLYEGY